MVANDDIASHSGASRRKASRSFSFLGCNAYSARIRNEICAKMFLSSFLSPTNITRLRIKNFLVFHIILSEYYEMPSSAAYLSLFSLRNSNAFCGPLLRCEGTCDLRSTLHNCVPQRPTLGETYPIRLSVMDQCFLLASLLHRPE